MRIFHFSAPKVLVFGSLGLSFALGSIACEPGAMACMIATSRFVAVLDQVSGDEDCLGEVEFLYGDYFLGENAEGKADPFDASIALTMERARRAIDEAEAHAKLLDAYENSCKDKSDEAEVDTDPNTDFLDDTFYALGKFDDPRPDRSEFCYGNRFDAAKLETPQMDAIPPCLDDEKDVGKDALPGISIAYEFDEVEIKVSPAVQGIVLMAKLDYEQDGCAASYRVQAISPAVTCESDKDCEEHPNLLDEVKSDGLRCQSVNATTSYCVPELD